MDQINLMIQIYIPYPNSIWGGGDFLHHGSLKAQVLKEYPVHPMLAVAMLDHQVSLRDIEI